MKDELKQIQEDIKDLKNRLVILTGREEAIKSKLINNDYIGKCFAYSIEVDPNSTIYICVQSISGNYFVCTQIVETNHAIGTDYIIKSKAYVFIDNSLPEITKEEFDNKLEEAFNSIKA